MQFYYADVDFINFPLAKLYQNALLLKTGQQKIKSIFLN